MSKLKKNKGITLIALVVTIVVLLILAGVSIATLTGENGLLNKTKDAKSETKIGEETEGIKLAITDARISDEGYQELTFENLQNAITHQFGDIAEVIENLDGTFLVKIKDRAYNVSSNGTVFLKDKNSFSSLITPKNYGDKVEYNANGISDWKIFYNDGNNVFLIASDYLNNTKVPADLGIIGEGIYKVSWKESIYNGAEDIKPNVAHKYMLKCFSNNKYSMRNVSSLMDTEKWNIFVDSNVADSAIGSPTIEMFCNSWNQKGHIKLYCNNTDERGYYIGINNIPPTTTCDISNDIGYNDKLYFPHQELTEDECWGYLLASTVATDSGNVMRISKSGSIHVRNCSIARESLRPVICLKSTVNGVWNNEKNEWLLK